MRTPWYKKNSGALLLSSEKKALSQILPTLYGYHLLQIAPKEFFNCVESSLILNCVNTQLHMVAHEEALPILSETIDVVVLAHTLEQAATGSHPHQILREAYRVLIPGGHIVITGFNPFSGWGLSIMMEHIKLVSRHTVKDWLSLLDFELVHSSSGSIKSFFEPIYTMVAVKRIAPLTLIKPAWSEKKIEWAQEEGLY